VGFGLVSHMLHMIDTGCSDIALNAAKKIAKLVAKSTMAKVDTNVVDTVQYICSEDLGHLGDGHDSYN